ncbi:MAG: ATP-binding protein [Candidatus Sericytochromatia bacterium]
MARSQRQAHHFRMLFEHNPLPMWMCHPESLKITAVNAAATQHYGYTRDEFLNLYLGELENQQPSQVQQHIQQGHAMPLLHHRTQQGQILHVWLKHQVIEEALLVAAIDITRHTQIETQLHQANQLLERQNQDLHQFTYIVSHNLRAPAANILGLLAIYNTQDHHDPLNPELIAKLQASAQLLNHTLQDLNVILATRANSNAQSEPIRLREIVETSLNSQSYLLPSPHLWAYQINIPPEWEVLTIRGYLVSILSNLISNAIKYRAPERPLRLDITAQRRPNSMEISIQDNGRGIDLQRHGKSLFGFHQRFHADIEGQGLGLYLVKTQIEILGGQIEVESIPDQGSCFRISLPLSPPVPHRETALLSKIP